MKRGGRAQTRGRCAKWVRQGEREPGASLPPPRGGLRQGPVGAVGSERAEKELSRPGSLCTSAGNVPLTYIFFQTYVTFFFSPSLSFCGRRQARIQEKEKLGRGRKAKQRKKM